MQDYAFLNNVGAGACGLSDSQFFGFPGFHGAVLHFSVCFAIPSLLCVLSPVLLVVFSFTDS
jgi:hypothetical protein